MEQGPEGGRSIDDYESVLKFKREELEGKMVLDLGAGPNARFSRDLEESGVKATVISLSPEYANEEQRKLFKPSFLEKIKKTIKSEGDRAVLEVAGVGEELPFADESFDEILALFSVSVWSEYNYKLWIPEICRVLKINGEARIGPIKEPRFRMDEGPEVIENWKRLRKWIEDFVQGLGYESEYIPGPVTRQEILIIRKPEVISTEK